MNHVHNFTRYNKKDEQYRIDQYYSKLSVICNTMSYSFNHFIITNNHVIFCPYGTLFNSNYDNCNNDDNDSPHGKYYDDI